MNTDMNRRRLFARALGFTGVAIVASVLPALAFAGDDMNDDAEFGQNRKDLRPDAAIEADGGMIWKEVGVDKFAESQEEAIRRLPEALKLLKFDADKSRQFIALVAKYPNGMRPGKIELNDVLDAMVWGGKTPRVDNYVVFRPQNLNLPKGTELKINTLEWHLDGTENTDVLILPAPCGNWCYRMSQLVVKATKCIIVKFIVPQGTTKVHFQLYGPRPLDANSCWGLKQPGDSGFMMPPSGCDSICRFERVENFMADREHFTIDQGSKLAGSYTPKAFGEHQFRVPRQVQTDGFVLSICIDVIDPPGSPVKRSSSSNVAFHATDHTSQYMMKTFEF